MRLPRTNETAEDYANYAARYALSELSEGLQNKYNLTATQGCLLAARLIQQMSSSLGNAPNFVDVLAREIKR
ncbi:MAG: hypothetical protein AAF316_00560 [Cyanobacteria bacterium P01_A01_bin.80]